MWDTSSPPAQRELFSLGGHTNRVYALEFDPRKPGRLYSAGEDMGGVWDIDGRQLAGKFPAIWDLTVSRDGKYLVHPTPARATGYDSGRPGLHHPAVDLNETDAISVLQESPNPENKLYFCGDISPDNQWIAGGTSNGEIHVWKREGGAPRLKLLGHHAYLVRVRFSPDGRHLVSLAEDGEILRWDATRLTRPQEAIQLLPPTAMREIANIDFSQDGRRLATGDGFGGILVLDVDTGGTLLSIPGAHGGIVVSTRFSRDGRWIASGGTDNVVRLWDAATGRSKGTLIGHTSAVNDVAFSPDGKHLASAGWDQTVKVWAIDLR